MVSGIAINIEMPRRKMKFLLSRYIRFPILAPNTFRILISFVLVSVVKITIPSKPMKAMHIARKERYPMTFILDEKSL